VRIWGRVALGGIAVLTPSFVITIPAGAAQSHPGGVPDTCPEVLAGAPTGGVEKVTDPAVRLATLALLLGGICLLASWRPGRSTASESE
jgi:hypothetical protein